MFELSPAVIESLLFAMEDQDRRSVVDLESGAVRAAEAGGAGGAGTAPIPGWSSREGFQVMEGFLASLRRPGPRQELQEALSRGRGVFKAYKETLAAWPEVEKSFRDYKYRAMCAVIRTWYDELRERAGLERLPPEPEEEPDLVLTDFDIKEAGPAGGTEALLSLLAAAEDEALASPMPALLVACEAERLREILAEEDWVGAWIDDGEGGAIAGAVALLDGLAGQAFLRVIFLHVLPDFRRSGMGIALLERLSGLLRGSASQLLVLDAPLLPPELATPLAARGFSPWGLRLLRRV